MSKVKDLSSKMKLDPAEVELSFPSTDRPMGEKLGGLEMYSNTFKRGYGDAVFGSDSNGIWLGKADFDESPFRVDMDGNMTATLADIVGSISGGTIDIGGADATSFHVDVDGNIWSGSYAYATAPFKISSAGAVTASNLVITGGSISVGTSAFHVDTAGNMWWGASTTYAGATIKISSAGSINFTSGTFSGTLSSAAGTLGSITSGLLTIGGVNIVGNGMVLDNNYQIAFYKNGNVNLDGSIYKDGSNNLHMITLNAKVLLTSYTDEVQLYSNNGKALWCDTSQKTHVNSPLYVGGTPKTAVVPTSEGYKALYCVESPEVWFMDFCDSKDNIDSLYLEATEGEMKFIKLDGGGYQVWRRRKGHAGKRFEDKTEEEFDKNNKFWATPTI